MYIMKIPLLERMLWQGYAFALPHGMMVMKHYASNAPHEWQINQ